MYCIMASLKQHINEIKEKYGFVFKKELGQNFLIDDNILTKIIQRADIKSDELLLEIGTGLGFLTLQLAKKAKKVITVEKDATLIPILQDIFAEHSNIELQAEDVLKMRLPEQEYRVIANIPYYLTSPLITRFLQADTPPQSLMLMVQKEIAEKITMQGKENILSLLVKIYGSAEKLFLVKKGSFFPPPNIDSAILRINLNEIPVHDNHKGLYSFIQKGFTTKRKQLGNSLKNGLHISAEHVATILNGAEINSKSRAEDLQLDDWIRMFETYTREIAR